MDHCLWAFHTHLKTLLKIVAAKTPHPLVNLALKMYLGSRFRWEELPSRKESSLRELPQMEMSPWAGEQNKTLFLKRAQQKHTIKLRADHSYLPNRTL